MSREPKPNGVVVLPVDRFGRVVLAEGRTENHGKTEKISSLVAQLAALCPSVAQVWARYGHHQILLETTMCEGFGGAIEPSGLGVETPREAALREGVEELGLPFDPDALTFCSELLLLQQLRGGELVNFAALSAVLTLGETQIHDLLQRMQLRIISPDALIAVATDMIGEESLRPVTAAQILFHLQRNN